MKAIRYVFTFIFFACCVSCTQKKHISIVSYNAQTFFDAVCDGREFKEFRKKESFGETEYNERLMRLIKAVKMCSYGLAERDEMPDILVLQEIESDVVVRDLCKRLDVNDGYKHFVFLEPEDGGAFNTAILSKHEVLFAKAHNVYSSEKILRPLIEADIAIKTNGRNMNITLFGVHWKSKRDGSAHIRAMQEELLYKRMKEKEKVSDYVIACGDFNQEADDFLMINSFRNGWELYDGLANEDSGQTSEDEVSSESYRDDIFAGDERYETATSAVDAGKFGSYCYKGKWQRLDNILYSGLLDAQAVMQAQKFVVVRDFPLVMDGKINRYNVGTKQGYSDHLPVGLLVKVL